MCGKERRGRRSKICCEALRARCLNPPVQHSSSPSFSALLKLRNGILQRSSTGTLGHTDHRQRESFGWGADATSYLILISLGIDPMLARAGRSHLQPEAKSPGLRWSNGQTVTWTIAKRCPASLVQLPVCRPRVSLQLRARGRNRPFLLNPAAYVLSAIADPLFVNIEPDVIHMSVEEPAWLFSESTSPLRSAFCTPCALRSIYIQTNRPEFISSPPFTVIYFFPVFWYARLTKRKTGLV
jgi:hypothetical protein